MEAIVLAGGFGTRLQQAVPDLPKPLAPVAGKPFIRYILEWLTDNQITRVILAVGYKWERIREELGDRFRSIELVYSVEDQPLGTGGAIRKAMNSLTGDRFFIINGDTYCKLDLSQLCLFHHAGNFELSMVLKPMDDAGRYGLVTIDHKKRVTGFSEKQPGSRGLINAGVYLTNSSIRTYFPDQENFSFEKDLLQAQLLRIVSGGLVTDPYFIDIGIPADYQRAQTEMSADR